MRWPDIYDEDLSTSKGHELVKQALDYASGKFASRQARLKEIQKGYDSFNGVVTEDDKKILSKYKSGNDSKTPYKKYRLGRSKMKQIHGEFLEISLDPSVYTVNPDAHNRKMESYMEKMGLLHAKKHIEKQREMGYSSMAGMKLPESKEGILGASSFKLINELAMQSILNDKMINEPIIDVFFENWKDMSICSELFCRVERDNNGLETIRYIHPKHWLAEESVFDPFLERSPFKGEVRPMYPHEILANRNWNISKEDREKLKKGEYSSDDETTDSYIVGDKRTMNVYSIEVKTYDPAYFKISTPKNGGYPLEVEIPGKTYRKDKAKIDRDVKNGKYKIKVYDREVIWELVKIGTDIYLKAKKLNDTIVFYRNGKLTAESSYTGFLFNTTDGARISLQDVLLDYEQIYDDIRFRINRELKRIKGKLLVLDQAFMETDKISSLVEKITEDGIVTINSAHAMDQGLDPRSALGVSEYDLGNSQALPILMAQAMDIERLVDKVTGMNDNRQGLTKATTTATTNINNIQASRSMTYDMFFFMGKYISRVLMKLIQKAKLNEAYNSDYREFIYDEQIKQYIKLTKEFSLDHYGITITDGKREKEAMAKAELFFPQEINAGMLRSKDVLRFFTKSSFVEALKVLDDAAREMTAFQQSQSQQAIDQKDRSDQMRMKMAEDDREDSQAHDTDMEVLRNEGKKEQIVLQKGLESNLQTQKSSNDMSLEKIKSKNKPVTKK